MHLRFVTLMTDIRHVNAAPVFFGGCLLALNKKTGGIRPIVNGFTLRRLASKCANSFGTKKLASFFYPHQLGIGTPGGCEAAVHSARRYLEALPEDHVLVNLTLAMLLTAYIGGRCFWQFTAECQSYTPSAAQLTISHPFCFLANTLFSLKRVSNKVTQLGHFSSVIVILSSAIAVIFAFQS